MDDSTTSLGQNLISGPKLSRNCTIPENILEFSFSFGYDCKRLFNLCLIEPDVLCFASGNLIHFLRVSTGEVHTRRSACGGGIGYITKNPVTDKYPKHLVVAENGISPPIIVYDYPSMDVISLLKGGTSKCYTKVDHSPDGEMLASQGGKPDYMLTIWNWKTGEMILRGQSFSNDVVNVVFSPWVPGHLSTSGAGHIKFWKMANTFTGVKLQGSLGRFGKTEISDIVGIYPMADEKVLSGSEWGNILVWDGGIIKLEVFRKGRKLCHGAPITQILMQNKDELITVGQDGYIRVWFWETVELAEPPEDDRIVEIDPIYEFRIGNAELMGMVKKTEAEDDFKWYVQTAGKGGIWECDISPEYDTDPPKQIFKCHAGAIVCVQTSPISHHVATLGVDGRIFVYDFDRNKCLFDHQFLAAGRNMIWLPLTVDPSGIVIVIGFSDGIIRSVTVDLSENCMGDRVQLIQLIKPHSKAITKLSINMRETILLSGSEDETIFVHKLIKGIPYVSLLPISLVNLCAVPTVINWHPDSHCKALIGCSHGKIVEVDISDREGSHIDLTFQASHVQLKSLTFKSTKSEIRRNIRLQEIEAAKEGKLLKKQRSLERLRRENPEVEIDEQTFLADSDDEEELDELYIPPIGNPILWLTYAQNGMILLMVGGYDAGYVYEYDADSLESDMDPIQPTRCTLIPQGDDIEVHSVVSFEDHLIFGMGDGSIRINKIENDDPTNLSDYWLLHMHDNLNGQMSMCFSHDHEYLVTAGADGNLFTYKWTTAIEKGEPIDLLPVKVLDRKVYDIDDPSHLSLEQQKQKDNHDRRMAIADEKKRGVLQVIEGLRQRYQKILERNNQLPLSQQLTPADLEIDPRLTTDLTMKLTREMELINQKMAFDVEKEKLAHRKLLEYFIEPLQSFPIEVIGINTQRSVKTIRIQKLSDEFHGLKDDLKERIRRDKERKRISDMMEASYIASKDESTQRTESFLYGLSESRRLESKMERLLNKYRERKAREEKRKYEWQQVNAEKPDPNKNHPDDDKALQEAENSIGDYKLKTDDAYDPPEDVRDTLFKKFEELLRIREEIYRKRRGFNDEVIKLRDKKLEIDDYINRKTEELTHIHQYLDENERKFPTVSVNFCDEREFPEKLLELEFYSKRKQSIQEQHLQERLKHVIPTHPDDIKMTYLRPLEENFDFDAPNVTMTEDIRAELKRLEAENTKNTTYENEQLEYNHCHNLFRQGRILNKIDERIQMFDNELEMLFEKRLQVQVEAKFLDNYLLTLNQEVWLLKDYEKIEENYIIDVEKNIVERNRLHREIQAIRVALEAKRKHLDREKEQLKSLLVQFKTKCMVDKFAPFLKKIFKKKLRPPKSTDADSESSTSESSESDDDDDDARSEGSNDMAFLYLDENQCPKGCDLTLYQMVFQMREERYKGEAEIRNAQAFMEKSSEEIEKLSKTFKATQAELDHCKMKLSMFRREKQKKLNDVETLVILRMDQLQHFTNEDDFAKIENTLLFNNSNVGKLYSRVGQITLETLETKRRHRVNIVHLARINTDIKFMEQQIVDLKDEINGTMMKKFGRIVDLDELEETILRQMVYNMRANVDDVKKEYARKTAAIEKEYAKMQDQLKNVLQRKTEKLNILTVLEEEKNYLDTVLWNQQKQMWQPESNRINYSEDLKKLKEIMAQQLEQIVAIHREIQTLTLKNKPLTPSPLNMRDAMKSQPQTATTSDHNQHLAMNMSSSLAGNTRAESLDNEFYEEICAMIEQYLTRHLSQSTDPKELIDVQDNVVRYLIGLSASFESELSGDFLPRMVETLKTFLPKQQLSAEALEELLIVVGDVMKFLCDTNNVAAKEMISDPEDD